MPVSDLYVIFPEQVRDGVNTRLSDELIEELLNTWTLAWHPSILMRFQSIPRVLYADALPDQLKGSLVLVPGRLFAGRPELSETLRDRHAQVASVTEPRTHAEELFRRIDVPDNGASTAAAAADFFALGYAALQIENLARRLQFTSQYDPAILRDRCIVAAQAAQLGPGTALENAIHACFDALSDIRHHFYPVDIYLLDWSLFPATLTANEAQRALLSPIKRNLWMSGRQLRQLDPTILGILRQGLNEHRFALIGLEEDEFALPLWPANLAISEVQRGLKICQELLGLRPHVFARRRFGLSARWPMFLPKLAYEGAVHAVLDDGRFPRAAQPRTQWYGLGCASVDTAACVPLDTRKASTFLQLAHHIGASIESDYVATVCLAGWLGESNQWCQDLRRACQWAPVVGRFVTFDDYVRQTSPMGQHADFPAGEYLSPYLVQSIHARQSNPVSRWPSSWRQWNRLEAAQALTTWAMMVQPQAEPGVETLLHELDQERKRLVEATDPPSGRSAEAVASTDEGVSRLVAHAAQLLAHQLASPASAKAGAKPGHLIMNPTSQDLRLAVCGKFSESSSLSESAGVYARQCNFEGDDELIVDIPASGYLWLPINPSSMITHDHAEAPSRSISMGVIASEWQLGNEFLRARIDPESGGLAGLYAQGQRANRLSQRLFVVRDRDRHQSSADVHSPLVVPSRETDLEHSRSPQSRMLADDICIEANSPVRGAIVACGRVLSPDDRLLARYSQRFELWRGMRHVTLEVTLQLLDPCLLDPWENYVASRVAWRSARARLSGAVQEMVLPMSGPRFDSPLGFEIADGDERTWVQTAGLPFHRRVAPQQCDTILACAGETEQQFRLRFCVDPPQPLQSALGALERPICHRTFAPRDPRGWLVHLDARHVVMSDWRPVWKDRRAIGVRIRLWESSGQMTHASLRAARPFQFAQKCDFLGDAMSTCPVEDGIVRVTLAPFEWTDLECHW